MSENSVNRGSINRTVESEIKFAGSESKDKMYESKHKRKIIRVLTVIAYVFSVSLAAIMLSLFYIFIYNPAKTTAENEKAQGIRGSIDFAVQKITHDSTNSTLVREEPKALPLEGLKLLIRKKRNMDAEFIEKNLGVLKTKQKKFFIK